MRPGDLIWVRIYKSDGQLHRAWRAPVESVADGQIVTFTEANNPIYTLTQNYSLSHSIRCFLWPGRRHTLLEVYTTDGELHELFADITSPIEIVDGEVHFIDHELDVQMALGGDPCIVDQDEFAEAALKYGYTEAFVRECYTLAEQLLELLANWRPLGIRT
jgi:protein associated with RNAse G/E